MKENTQLAQTKLFGPRIMVAMDPKSVIKNSIITSQGMHPLDVQISRGTVVLSSKIDGLELPQPGDRVAFVTPYPGQDTQIGLDGNIYLILEFHSIICTLPPLTEEEQKIIDDSRNEAIKKINNTAKGKGNLSVN